MRASRLPDCMAWWSLTSSALVFLSRKFTPQKVSLGISSSTATPSVRPSVDRRVPITRARNASPERRLVNSSRLPPRLSGNTDGKTDAPPFFCLYRRSVGSHVDHSDGHSLGDDAVGPLDQAHENCGTSEFCSPLSYICFRDPTGPAAGSSSKDGNVFGHDFFERFAEWRPAHRHDSIGGHFAHQRGGFAEEENLNLVAGFRERESVMKRKCGLCGTIGAPGALHHDF